MHDAISGSGGKLAPEWNIPYLAFATRTAGGETGNLLSTTGVVGNMLYDVPDQAQDTDGSSATVNSYRMNVTCGYITLEDQPKFFQPHNGNPNGNQNLTMSRSLPGSFSCCPLTQSTFSIAPSTYMVLVPRTLSKFSRTHGQLPQHCFDDKHCGFLGEYSSATEY